MPMFKLDKFNEMNVLDFLTNIEIIPSKSEARRLIESNGISINKEKIIDVNLLINEKSFNNNEIIVQKGKKTFLKVIK